MAKEYKINGRQKRKEKEGMKKRVENVGIKRRLYEGRK